jgi:hypothetical protein
MKSFMMFTPHPMFFEGKNEKNEMGGPYRTYGERCIQVSGGKT